MVSDPTDKKLNITPSKVKIFILDDEVITVQRLVQALNKEGYEVEGFISGQECLQRVKNSPPDLIIMDIHLNDGDGIDLMQRMLVVAPEIEVILMTGYASFDQAVKATKKGAFNYLEKPLKLETVKETVQKALANSLQKHEKNQFNQDINLSDRFGEIIGVSQAMRNIFKTVSQVAPLDCNVLLESESGTGKELIARSIHINSQRRDKPFVPFNCGAFTDSLFVSELFGHEKGAFTGAVATKLGILETVNGGTIFLDEIGDMPLSLQVKLLRVIQERNFLRVGGTKNVQVDIRIIAASNRDLAHLIKKGEFRQDLYYRLNVVEITLPPLRQRQDDIPLLAEHFVSKFAKRFNKPQLVISQEVISELEQYTFPGNVRELENIMERAVALCQSECIKLEDLPPDLLSLTVLPEDGHIREGVTKIKDLEQDHIAKIYRDTGFNQTETARRLGISRTTLWRHFRKTEPAK